MRRLVALLAGGLGLAGLVRARRRSAGPVPAVDPRADELRRKLDESKAIVDEREEFELGEAPVNEVDVDTRRAAVHEQARAAIDSIKSEETP